ncbi:g2923 [Coccomyxa viridis]|uniref:G2923 protein n=1 Tax=Coccomyxa viridis TaxID=1274662 RepID=A0ABP1FN81_9CHLO
MAHALAGAAAGMAETAVMYPLDTIKTRLQAATGLGPAGSIVQMTRQLISTQGIASLYRGLTPAVLGAGPAHALYYAVYEQTKATLGARQSGQSPATAAAAGVAATVVNDAVMVPADVVKQRLQVSQGQYRGMLDCVMQTWQREGPGAFYRSYPVTLFMNIPWVVLHFPLYETSKQLMAPRHHGTEGPAVQIVAGGIAGGVAAALTTPFDVVKTRLQTSGEGVSLRSALNAPALMRQIAREEGFGALWRGNATAEAMHRT